MFFDQLKQLCPTLSSLCGCSLRGNFHKKLTDFCVFVVHYYVLAWFSAMSAAAVSHMDLTHLKELAMHTDQAFTCHLWYLSEVTVGVSLFDDGVSSRKKKAMVNRMNTDEGLEEPRSHLHSVPEHVVDKSLPDLFTSMTKIVLQHLDINTSFLGADLVTWASTEAYARGKERVAKLLVTNGVAERGVAITQEFTKEGMTTQEDRLQVMGQVIEEH